MEYFKIGVKLLYLYLEDSENFFFISFFIFFLNSIGVIYILEYFVLVGLEKYFVWELFFEMLKMSLVIFINVMIGFDCIYYLVFSKVK